MTSEPVKVKLAVNDLVCTDDDNEVDENVISIMACESDKRDRERGTDSVPVMIIRMIRN